MTSEWKYQGILSLHVLRGHVWGPLWLNHSNNPPPLPFCHCDGTQSWYIWGCMLVHGVVCRSFMGSPEPPHIQRQASFIDCIGLSPKYWNKEIHFGQSQYGSNDVQKCLQLLFVFQFPNTPSNWADEPLMSWRQTPCEIYSQPLRDLSPRKRAMLWQCSILWNLFLTKNIARIANAVQCHN